MTAVVNSGTAGGTPSSRIGRTFSETPSADSRIQANGVQVSQLTLAHVSY